MLDFLMVWADALTISSSSSSSSSSSRFQGSLESSIIVFNIWRLQKNGRGVRKSIEVAAGRIALGVMF